MDLNEIPPFSVHCTEMTVRTGPKFLSEQEFAVIIFAGLGDLRAFPGLEESAGDLRGRVVEKRQENDSAPGLLQP